MPDVLGHKYQVKKKWQVHQEVVFQDQTSVVHQMQRLQSSVYEPIHRSLYYRLRKYLTIYNK